ARAGQFVLGLTTPQMNRDHDYGAVRDNQLRAMEHIGLFKARKLPKAPDKYAHLTDPYDASQSLEARARSYLQSNCAHCHVEAGGGNSAINLAQSAKTDAMRAIGIEPIHDKFGLPDARIIAPGKPDSSVLLHRIAKLGIGRMPPLASSVVDDAAVKVIRDWIASLPPNAAAQ
ncbi:MAG: heme-binding domain-containing protein, partial [Verrucomicrobia bacterium]|nr:heme-binding domain-containing protein [Verrucomicrobiota bacterium]